MKKALLTFAIAAVSPVAAQAEGPIDGTIYGKIHVTVESQDDGTDTVSALESNASRLGFKGKTKISDALTVIYQAEYEIDADGDEFVFKSRNIYAGLQGNFGTVIAGNHDTPVKLLQNKIDLFNDMQGDIKHMISKSEIRANNLVMYSTPAMGGFFANVAAVMSEAEEPDNGYSLTAGWANDSLYFGLGYDDNLFDKGIADPDDYDGLSVLRAVAQAKFGDFQLGALVERAEYDFDAFGTPMSADPDGWLVSGQWKIGGSGWALKAQYGQSDLKESGGEALSLGADYKLAKNTKLLGFVTKNDADEDEVDETFVGLGLEHKF